MRLVPGWLACARIFVIGLAASLVFIACSGGAEPPAASITLQPVRYRQLVDAVKAQRGKVLVVDVWGVL
jgi:hypothetical protein